MKNIKNLAAKLWQDEAGQGATEYILLLVVVVGIAMAFKTKITTIVNEKLGDLSSSIGGFTSN